MNCLAYLTLALLAQLVKHLSDDPRVSGLSTGLANARDLSGLAVRSISIYVMVKFRRYAGVNEILYLYRVP